MASQKKDIFHPFLMFNNKVERKYTLHPQDIKDKDEEYLNELIDMELRVFDINGEEYYYGRDVLSFLGIRLSNHSKAYDRLNKDNPDYLIKSRIFIDNNKKYAKKNIKINKIMKI